MNDSTLLHLILIVAVLSLASNALVLDQVRTSSRSSTSASNAPGSGPPSNYQIYQDSMIFCRGDEGCIEDHSKCYDGCSDLYWQEQNTITKGAFHSQVCYLFCNECISACTGATTSRCECRYDDILGGLRMDRFVIGTIRDVVRICDHDHTCIQNCVEAIKINGELPSGEGLTASCLRPNETAG